MTIREALTIRKGSFRDRKRRLANCTYSEGSRRARRPKLSTERAWRARWRAKRIELQP